MEKRLSRLSERITIVLTAAFLLGVVLLWMFSDSSPYFLTFVMFLIWDIRLIATQRCPHCGKWLFTVDEYATGAIYVWCRYCRKEIKIILESL